MTETINKAHSVYDIEKRRQAQREDEKARAASDAGVYIASKNPNMWHPGSPTPSSQVVQTDTRGMMHPGGEVYIKEEPKGLRKIASIAAESPVGGETPNPYQDFVKTLEKPITPEEEARRERAARAVQGVAGLGNLMSAFANLTFTGKGAPSQTLPTQSVDAMTDKMTSWKDKLKAEREKYQAAELGAKVQQWKMAQDERRYADALKQQGIDNELKLGNLEISRAKLAHDIDYAKQMLDLRTQELIQNGIKADRAWAQATRELGLKEKQLGLSEKELEARTNGTYYSGSSSSKWTPVSTHVGNMEIDYNRLNGVNLAQYAKRLEENGDDELSKAIAALGNGKESTEQLRQKIGKALTNPANAWLVEDMMNKGLLRNAQAGTGNNTDGATDGWTPEDVSPLNKKK